MKKMNLPNKLSLFRLCLVPIILVVGLLTPKYSVVEPSVGFYISSLVCALLFIVASFTDLLDGRIARRNGLITDFGKFIDPIADKFMVIGALFVCLYKFENLQWLMIVSLLVVVFREMAITAIRLVAAKSNVVLSANMLGKLKTVSQMVAISAIFLEPVIQWGIKAITEAVAGHPVAWRYDILPLTWSMVALSLVLTVWSGISYLKSYWKYLDPEK